MPTGVAEVFQRKTSHLTDRDANFFRKWDRLITLEEKEAGRFRGEIWRMTAAQRQKVGRAFADMVIDPEGPGERFQGKDHRFDIHRFTYRLRPARMGQDDATVSLLSGHMAEHDPIVVSSEGHKVGLARGFILELTPSSVVVGVDHPLPHGISSPVLRVDKDELQAGLGRLRDNLARLFYADGDERRRSLIVDLRPPQFLDAEATKLDGLSHLNEEQRDAVARVMSAQDYALILGVPGAGKTSTVAQIIRTLVDQGKTILLTSYTHSAVDTIAVKLVEAGVDILRLGHRDKVDPRLLDSTLDDDKSVTTVEALEARMLRPPVVAATSLAINHPLFCRRHFDYCIVDEASQITLPTCLGPLRFADRFVLVGDHHQLPPLVKSASARVGGMDISLFKLLSEAHPTAMVELTRQYRMNEDIMSLSNALVYDGKLRCGNDEVAGRVLRLPKEPSSPDLHGAAGACSRCWVAELLRPERRVVFVDTDKLPATESRVGNLIQNEVEAGLIYQVRALACLGARVDCSCPRRSSCRPSCLVGWRPARRPSSLRTDSRSSSCATFLATRLRSRSSRPTRPKGATRNASSCRWCDPTTRARWATS